jgi:hypothetical protein
MDVKADDSLDTSGQWQELNLENLEEVIEEDEEDTTDNVDEEDLEEDVNVDSSNDDDDDEDDEEDLEEDETDEEDVNTESDSEEDADGNNTEDSKEDDNDKEVKRKRDAQTRIRELANKAREKEQENQALRDELLSLRKSKKEVEKENSKTSKEALEQSLKQSQATLKKAFEEGDAETFSKAQSEVNDKQIRLMALDAYHQNTFSSDEEDTEEGTGDKKAATNAQVSREDAILSLPEKAQDWAMEKEWFMSNKVLTQATLEIAAQLEAEGLSIEESNFYEELDGELAKRFPRKFKTSTEEDTSAGTTKKKKKTPKMGSSSNTASTSKKRRKVTNQKLTAAQRQMAKSMGVSEKAYAVQLAKQEASEGRGWIPLEH